MAHEPRDDIDGYGYCWFRDAWTDVLVGLAEFRAINLTWAALDLVRTGGPGIARTTDIVDTFDLFVFKNGLFGFSGLGMLTQEEVERTLLSRSADIGLARFSLGAQNAAMFIEPQTTNPEGLGLFSSPSLIANIFDFVGPMLVHQLWFRVIPSVVGDMTCVPFHEIMFHEFMFLTDHQPRAPSILPASVRCD